MSVAQSNHFKHDPLDQNQASIRLVKILRKKSRGGLLQCEMHHTTVDASYICLSYVWGETPTADGLRPILINGQHFYVRPNLYAFLKASRSRYAKTMLWIDALCIDQMNTLERNHQVQQMGEIFSRAKYVIAWLGDDRFAERSLVMFRALASYSRARSLVQFLSTLLHLMRLNDDDDLYAALREYWSRAWITQEVALARQVRLRARKAEWKLPASLDQHWDDISKPPGEGGDKILDSIPKLSSTRHDDWQYGLMELLCGLAYKNCSDPRDRIYSLLSLCRERDVLKVDYGVSEVRLLCHVLKTSNATCFCTLFAVRYALELPALARHKSPYGSHDDELWETDIFELKFDTFVLCGLGTTSWKLPEDSLTPCGYCGYRLQSLMRDISTVVFCLKSVCERTKGHIMWEQPILSNQPDKGQMRGWIYYICESDSGKETIQYLGEMGEMVTVTTSEARDMYRVRLKLSALLIIARGRYSFQTHGNSHMCRLVMS